MPQWSVLITAAIFAAVLLAAGWSLQSPGVDAQESVPIPSALTIQEMEPVTIRDTLVITAQLTDALGEAVGAVDNEALELFIDGEKVRRVRTEIDGSATFKVREELPAGTYEARVLYYGSKSLLASSATKEITIEPAEVGIVTIPPTPDVKFTIDGREFRSAINGIARTTVDHLGTYELEVHPEDTSTRQLKFNRWEDEVFDTHREIDIKRVQGLEVGFDVSYNVNTAFFDLEGLVVDPERISSVVLRSSHGTEKILEAPDLGTKEAGAVWLQAGRVVRRFHGLEETPILWSVDRVEMDGTSVVNRAQQRFFVKENDVWAIELLLYAARFIARDALFGFPLGAGVNLEYPNGTREVYRFGSSDDVMVQSLPRGEYRVNVAGAPGFSPYSPVALSRNQEVHLLVISYIDMGVAIALLGLLTIGLVVIGRPALLKHLRVPGRSHSHRRAFLVLAGLTLVVGVGILSLGLGQDSASSHAEPADSPTPVTDTPKALPPSFTTGDPDQVTSPPAAIADDTERIDDEQAMYEDRPTPRVAEVFQPFWERNGALTVFGRPTSRPIKRTDPASGLERVTQHFERHTLEYHSEFAGTAQEIQLRDLGTDRANQLGLTSTAPFERVTESSRTGADCRYFTVTGHYVCDSFLTYWNSHWLDLGDRGSTYQGSLALFGYPISEEFVDPETGRTVQYFERVRLEKYPEHSDTPHEVQQGDLKGAQK